MCYSIHNLDLVYSGEQNLSRRNKLRKSTSTETAPCFVRTAYCDAIGDGETCRIGPCTARKAPGWLFSLAMLLMEPREVSRKAVEGGPRLIVNAWLYYIGHIGLTRGSVDSSGWTREPKDALCCKVSLYPWLWRACQSYMLVRASTRSDKAVCGGASEVTLFHRRCRAPLHHPRRRVLSPAKATLSPLLRFSTEAPTARTGSRHAHSLQHGMGEQDEHGQGLKTPGDRQHRQTWARERQVSSTRRRSGLPACNSATAPKLWWVSYKRTMTLSR